MRHRAGWGRQGAGAASEPRARGSQLPFCLHQVAVGQHQEEYFTGPGPKEVLKQFREELAAMEKDVAARNAKLDIPYEYLLPSLVENSVAI